MKLPVDFLNRMQKLLGENEYEEFLNSYEMPRHYGLRVNTLKVAVEKFLGISPFNLEPVPWTADGFYYSEGDSPGRHPYYHAGLYYIQEPSAMLPGAILDAKPGEHVLDLCAAPGGKTVQMASGMKGKGILVANDISSDRVKALVKNIELCGVRNAIVTNESPGRLAENFAGYFDKVLVDAPCSGEGMFRKDEGAARSWEKYKCETCAEMQRDILDSVDVMLKPGGLFVYSTCTFSPDEDEKMINSFINKYKNYEVVDIPRQAGIEGGRPEWADGNAGLAGTARLWPHKVRGEGHFVALLKKSKGNEPSGPFEISATAKSPNKLPLQAFHKFVDENLNIDIDGHFGMKGANLYCLPEGIPKLDGIRVAKFGWYLGEFVRDRFEPSHSMAVSLKKEDVKNTVDFPMNSREVYGYLKGETIITDGHRGFTAVCVDGYTLGWAKQTGGMLKNLYPKGWRKMA